MKRKGASCSSKDRFTFNSELLRQPVASRAEVIVHLKVPNHGKLLRSVVRAHFTSERSAHR
jgi:hypothetical protein